MLHEQMADFKTEIFRAMAHPSRVGILDVLRGGEHSVMELCEELDLQHSNVSQQLSILRARNLVSTRKEGNVVYYSIKDKTVLKLLDITKELIDNQFKVLEAQFKKSKVASIALWFSLIDGSECFSDLFELFPVEIFQL